MYLHICTPAAVGDETERRLAIRQRADDVSNFVQSATPAAPAPSSLQLLRDVQRHEQGDHWDAANQPWAHDWGGVDDGAQDRLLGPGRARVAPVQAVKVFII